MNDVGIGHNAPPINPENILVLAPEEIPMLLDAEYKALADRSAELTRKAENWWKTHKAPGPGNRAVIKDEADYAASSDTYRQLFDHAGAKKEVEEARMRVNAAPRKAVEAINLWFNALRARPLAAMEAINAAQEDYTRQKLDREKKAAEEVARLAREAAEKARREAEAEAARAREEAEKLTKAAQADDVDDETFLAAYDARAALDEADTAAKLAAAAAANALAMPSLSVPDATRVRSHLGSVTSGREVYDWELEDMQKLCAAVAKGELPIDFVMPNKPVLDAAVRPKTGRRFIAGLRIFPRVAITRRGS